MIQKALLGIFVGLISFLPNSFAKQYSLQNGKVSFMLASPIGQLLAINEGVSGTMDSKTGMMHFNVSAGEFNFVTASAPDYINEITTKRYREYYLETEKYPDASFKGKITDLSKVNFAKEGTYNVSLRGIMKIHGTEQEVATSAAMIIKDNQIICKSAFVVKLSDYNVRIPEVLNDIFFKEVAIEVNCILK